jgi:uncharacterized damage-inducible protein DinB
VALEIVPIWKRLNEQLIQLVDQLPDERLDWSPQPDMWGFRRLFVHLAAEREEWMTRAINDGEPNVVSQSAQSKDQLKDALRSSWRRIERTITDQAKLDATYKDRWWAGAPLYDGHWVAFHLLEHDIHHRADMLVYLALLAVEVPSSFTQTP